MTFPKLLGRWALAGQVGRGGMGTVYRAVDVISGSNAAIKFVTAFDPADDDGRARFRGEVRAMARLDHPSVVQVHDYGEAPDGIPTIAAGSPFVVMEYASGRTVADAPPQDWLGTRALLIAVLQALAHAHARGVVHRDLKSRNVLWCTESDLRPGPKLADFGIARVADSADDDVTGGTPRYMAPEQIRRETRDEGPWTDLYALGVLAWEIAGGTAPFTGSEREILAAHLSAPLPPLTPRFAVPWGLEGWLRGLLRKVPWRRVPTAADALAELLELGPPDRPGRTAPPSEPPAITTTTGAAPTFRYDSAAPAPGSAPPEVTRHTPTARSLPPEWHNPPRLERPVAQGLGLVGIRVLPLVGRQLAEDQLWEAVAAGRPGVVILEGPVGSGKTRLVDQVCERAYEVGLAGRLTAAHQPEPGPGTGVGAMVAAWLGATGLSSDSAFQRISEVLARMGAEDHAEAQALTEVVAPGGQPLGRGERRAVLLRVLEKAAELRPQILVIDDAQWGAEALELALSALTAPHPPRILAVATVRPEELHQRPRERALLDALVATPGAKRISLGALAPEDQRVLLRDLVALGPALLARIEALAAGNPLFALELVAGLAQQDALERTRHGLELRRGARVSLPANLAAGWAARLDALLADRPEWEGISLEIAAVGGLAVEAREWTAACEAQGVAVAFDAAERMVERGLAVAAEGVRSSFALVHGLLRQALLDRADAAGRLRGHHRAYAGALAGDGPASAERRGRHLLAAGDPAAAVGPLLAGARLHYSGGNLDPAGDLVRLVAEILPEGHPGEVELCVLGQSISHNLGRAEESRRWLERGLASADRTRDDRAATRLWLSGATNARMAGDPARAALMLDEGEVTARRADDAIGLWRVDLGRGWLAVDAGRGREAWQAGRRVALAAAAAPVTAEDDLLCEAWRLAGHAAFQLGYLDRAREACAACRQAASALGSRIRLADAANSEGEVHRALGELDAAEAAYREAVRLFQACGSANAVICEANLGLVQLERTNWADAARTLTRALEGVDRIGWKPMIGALRLAAAAAAAGLGLYPEAEAHLAVGERVLEETPFIDVDVARSVALCAEILDRAGRSEGAARARALAERARR